MNKRIRTAIMILLVGLVALLGLQLLWTMSAYRSECRTLTQKAAVLADRAVSGYLWINAFTRYDSIQARYGRDMVPFLGGIDYHGQKLTMKIYDPQSGDYRRIEKKYDLLAEFATNADPNSVLYHVCGVDPERFDRMLDSLFRCNGIRTPHVVETVDRLTGAVLRTTAREGDDRRFTIRCDTLPLGIDDKEGLVVRFDGSLSGMPARLRAILLTSLVITLFIAILLVLLIRILIGQQRQSDFREEFVHHLIHEIRNPIAYLKRVLANPDDKEFPRRLQTAEGKIRRIDLLIEKLLSASSERLDIELRKVDIRRLLDDIRASYPDAEPEVEIEEGITAFRADPVHLSNALYNLVDNAVKYSPAAEKRVAIRCYLQSGMLCIDVRDWGVGIPGEFRPLVFDRYFRVPARRSTGATGFGLGLSYVRMVAEAHGGKVSLTACRPGSRFTLRIPYTPCDDQ